MDAQEINLEDYFNLVRKLVIPYIRHRPSIEIRDSEEFAEGLLFLVKARNYFDPKMNFKFSTYAYHYVKFGLMTWKRKNPHWDNELPSDELFIAPEEPEQQEELEFFKSLVDLFEDDDEKKLHTIFKLKLEGLTYLEIGERIGCTKQNVAQHFKRNILPIILESMGKRFSDYTAAKATPQTLQNHHKIGLTEPVEMLK